MREKWFLHVLFDNALRVFGNFSMPCSWNTYSITKLICFLLIFFLCGNLKKSCHKNRFFSWYIVINTNCRVFLGDVYFSYSYTIATHCTRLTRTKVTSIISVKHLTQSQPLIAVNTWNLKPLASPFAPWFVYTNQLWKEQPSTNCFRLLPCKHYTQKCTLREMYIQKHVRWRSNASNINRLAYYRGE